MMDNSFSFIKVNWEVVEVLCGRDQWGAQGHYCLNQITFKIFRFFCPCIK